jgi:hypothetical protein
MPLEGTGLKTYSQLPRMVFAGKHTPYQISGYALDSLFLNFRIYQRSQTKIELISFKSLMSSIKSTCCWTATQVLIRGGQVRTFSSMSTSMSTNSSSTAKSLPRMKISKFKHNYFEICLMLLQRNYRVYYGCTFTLDWWTEENS